jgi:predicted amidophosphoribosyltransferase
MKQQGAFTPLTAKKKYCGACGAPNELDSAFCEECGAPLADLAAAAASAAAGMQEEPESPEFVQTDAFATGLASWDLLPPQAVVRRRRGL